MSSCFFGGGRILIPNCDLSRWSTIACDQFTSDPDYWDQVEALAASVPSAYHITLPEIYLKERPENIRRRIASINETMREYWKARLFTAYEDAMIYVERTQADGRTRRGLLGLIDLEQYDYHNDSKSLIRATEETVLERIPPRMSIRRDAALEIPHLMLLADDAGDELIGPAAARKDSFECIYDFDLMLQSGHITGYLLDSAAKDSIRRTLDKFSDPDYFRNKYNTDKNPLVFAVGDGNHSLASAKECYELLKVKIGPEKAAAHPARYALAEVVNLHDPALDFEPIYRLVTGRELDELLGSLRCQNPAFHGGASKPGEISLHFQSGLEQRTLSLAAESGLLPVSVLQPLLDTFLQKSSAQIDYIHGLDMIRNLAKQDGHIGITFTGMQKSDLFPGIIKGGVLPRKTFSMGHGQDKRFYLECRVITEEL